MYLTVLFSITFSEVCEIIVTLNAARVHINLALLKEEIYKPLTAVMQRYKYTSLTVPLPFSSHVC
jgi:hypothetical protein